MVAGGVFKLAVSAIVLLALLAIIYLYIVPLFFPQADFSKELEKGFELAQANEGKTTSVERFTARAGQSINGKNFEDESTLVVFKCTDASLCCEDFKDCSNALSINTETKTILVKKNTQLQPFFRCIYEHRLYVCKAFFGFKPAQAEIISVNAAKNIDLGNGNKVAVSFEYKNVGELDALQSLTAKVKVFNKLDSNPLKQPLFESEKTIPELKAGEARSESIEAVLNSAGTFELRLFVESEEAGKDEKISEIKAVGSPATDCTAGSLESSEWYAGTIEELQGKCVSKASCEKCNTSFECRNAWLSREASVIEAGSDYAYVIESEQACSPPS